MERVLARTCICGEVVLRFLPLTLRGLSNPGSTKSVTMTTQGISAQEEYVAISPRYDIRTKIVENYVFISFSISYLTCTVVLYNFRIV